ncbi:MAG: acetyl-CoA synthase [Syntrophus sp. SKADARSKE-3]|nr:acetyl-CoA synthase [Syntrophus sp. SKADARSKE-3]
MSKIICTSAIDGAMAWIAEAEELLNRAIAEKGTSFTAAFPGTAYFLPVIYAFTGEKVRTLSDLRSILRQAKELLPPRPAAEVWLPYLGSALDAGVASLFACEIIEACKYAIGPDPVNGIWLGAANDVILRERGIEFVDGTAPGFAAITGAAPTNEIAVTIARQLQEKNLYVFMAGGSGGRQFADQLAEEGVQLGWPTRLIPFGPGVSALIYALGFANRVAMSFGGVQPGDYERNLLYNKNRTFAFILALGEVTPDKYAVAAGAINYGFPVIVDTDIPQILPTGVCTYEHVVSSVPYETIVERALEVRGCKIKVTKVPIPVPYGPAFEGELIRKADTHAEFGGNLTSAFEFVTSVNMDDITDGDIKIIGPDVDQIDPGGILPLAIWVEVAGRKMQPDFEPILERQIHHLVNGAEGIWHMGQRDIVWTRISKNGFARGLRLRHYGEIIHAKFISEYPAIVDKVKVTLVTDAYEVEQRLAVARRIYIERNRRLEAMTDESVETFYSCLLCQSFAPNHVCIITPERLGLCGAYNWLDGKAAYEINETGPNQPVAKGAVIDPVKGVWQGVNDYVYTNSHKTVAEFCCYSIMDRPMTSCGCFEAICAYLPECNGVMVVNREYQGETPVGMTFSSLAGSVGGGHQTPGFIGVGKVFLTSRKFLAAEGGFRRLVWMPKALKESLAADLKKRCTEQGVPDLFDKIADEEIGVDAMDIRPYLEQVRHPALDMPDILDYSASEPVVESVLPSVPDVIEPHPHPNPPLEGEGGRFITLPLEGEGAKSMASPLQREGERSVEPSLQRRELKSVALPPPEESARTEVPPLKDEGVESVAPRGDEEPGGRLTIDATACDGLSQEQAVSAPGILQTVTAFSIRREACEFPIWQVTIGATRKEGGTRSHTVIIGGADCMPFHLWEGDMPNRPVVAMEVFDVVSEKYPAVLRAIYGDLLAKPAEMARVCVAEYGADLISVRLDGTHPEKGNRTPEEAVALVKSVLAAVSVPLIVTGHSHYEKNNEVMKAIAQACAGENLLFNWVEQENYRTIAGAAIAYGHCVVAQSSIDVNIGKQLNILLTNMDVKPEQIVMNPMTGATGYGLEYTYSVMERIRLTGLGGDRMLTFPLIVSPGQECAKLKEYRASDADFPAWGNLDKRAALWELSTAVSFLYAGADLLIMYHPEAAIALKKTIAALMKGLIRK